MYCSKCGNKLTTNAKFCFSCGNEVSDQQEREERINQPTEVELGSQINNEVAHTLEDPSFVTMEQPMIEQTLPSENVEQIKLKTFVGKKYDYYNEKWKLMELKKNQQSWNWAAFFFSPIWFGYRRMYGPMFIILGLYLSFDAFFYFIEYEFSDESLFKSPIYYLQMSIAVISGLFGNYFYKKHAQKKISLVDQLHKDIPLTERFVLYKDKGGGKLSGIFAAIGTIVALAVISLSLFPTNIDIIDSVRQGEFEEFEGVTVEEAFEEFFRNTEWNLITREKNNTIVEFEGDALLHSNFVRVNIRFLVDDDYFEVQSITADGERLTPFEENELFEAIYEDY